MTPTSGHAAERARVLVIDDELALRQLLEVGLDQAGFTVRSAADGRAGLATLGEWKPSVIVLDVMLPDMDGFALLPHIRKLTEAPVVMLSAKTEVAERIAGLQVGADDYLGKPFELEELVARLHTALRRPRMETHQMYEYADITIDASARTVFRRNRRIDLTPREFDLLVVFARHPEQVLTRSILLDVVWGIDRDVVPNTVETYVSYLRAKIDSGERVKLIHTLRGAGYTMRASKS